MNLQDIDNNFTQIFLPELIKAYGQGDNSKYIEDSPVETIIPNILLRRIQYIYKKISIDKTESNLEIIVNNNNNNYQINFYDGDIYKTGLSTFRINADKIILYGINKDIFPAVEEITFAENNKYYFAIKMLDNGIFFLYGHPSKKLNDLINEKKEESLKKYGENAWSETLDGNPRWYSDLSSIKLNNNKKFFVNDLIDISKTYEMPIYLPQYTLDYYYENYINAAKVNGEVSYDLISINTQIMPVIKIESNSDFYKSVLLNIP